jgi:hypothetical protein
MKTIISQKQPIGGDGAQASESLSLDGGNLVADIQVTYPVAKLLSPVNTEIDKAAALIESKLPLGGGMKAILDPIIAGLKAEILKVLSE